MSDEAAVHHFDSAPTGDDVDALRARLDFAGLADAAIARAPAIAGGGLAVSFTRVVTPAEDAVVMACLDLGNRP